MNLLLVEDEKTLLLTIREYLEKQGYSVTTAHTLHQSLDEIIFIEFDCVVVDIGLPDGTGLDLIRRLKAKQANSRIIIISAKNTLEDKLTGLDLGSDDYLTKPFDLPELNARLRSVLRRRLFLGNMALELGTLTIFPDEQRVQVTGQTIGLTATEYRLLLFMATNKNRIISKTALAEHVWGNAADLADSHEFIYSHIKNLRKKLVAGGCPDYIRTRYGVGYVFYLDV